MTTVDWPELPPGAVILYEWVSNVCPKRMIMAPRDEGFEIVIVGKVGVDSDEPPLSKENIITIAKKMVEVVSF